MSKLRRPSPALVVAVVALFMSISGTAYATGVVPLAKRALLAKNALKLQGKSARQVANIPGPATDLEGLLPEDIAAMPGPASTASTLVTTNTVPFALAPDEQKDFSAQCPGNSQALSGGFTTPDSVLAADTRPTASGTGWTLYLMNMSGSFSATGNVQVVCLF
jgi:hypothetical protein